LKKRTTLYLDEELIKTAKNLGLNLSRVCEIALEEAIKRMQGGSIKRDPEHYAFISEEWWSSAGRSPRLSYLGVLSILNGKYIFKFSE